jgi:hypothetical protein
VRRADNKINVRPYEGDGHMCWFQRKDIDSTIETVFIETEIICFRYQSQGSLWFMSAYLICRIEILVMLYLLSTLATSHGCYM